MRTIRLRLELIEEFHDRDGTVEFLDLASIESCHRIDVDAQPLAIPMLATRMGHAIAEVMDS